MSSALNRPEQFVQSWSQAGRAPFRSRAEEGSCQRGEFMRDVVFIGVTILFFVISVVYVYVCERLR
jgi:hypothetical protein